MSVTDPEDRVTGYGYFSDYLLNKTVYPTGGSTRYVYSVFEDSGYSKYRVSGQFMYPEELPLDPTIIELGSVKNIVELSEPHEYGWIWARTTSGYPGWYGVEKHTNTTSIHLQCETPGNYPADFYMGYLEWNTGRIPDNADVTKIYYSLSSVI